MGVYHSIYDSFFWMEKFGDPGFQYHALAARFYGILAMRLAAADVVPLRYAPYGRALERELELRRREVIRERRVWEAARARPDGTLPGAEAAEARKKQPLSPDFAPLARAIERFGAGARDLDASVARLEGAPPGAADPGALARLNDALVRIERAFLDPRGLPGRPWFRHTLYAPGFTTGYSSWPFPGVVQALDDRDPAAFEAQMRALISRFEAATEATAAARQAAEGLATRTQE